MPIDQETRKKVYEKARERCEGCGKRVNYECFEIHHRNFKSQYTRKDRDECWNLSCLCRECHYSIHSQGNIKLKQELIEKSRRDKPENERSNEQHRNQRRKFLPFYRKK